MVGYCYFSFFLHQTRAWMNPSWKNLWILLTLTPPNNYYKFPFSLLHGSNSMDDDDGTEEEEEEEEEDSGNLFEDRISSLPDHILSSILSLLTMKDEVKTIIISKRFKSLSRSRQTLDFDFAKLFGLPNIQDHKYYSIFMEEQYRSNYPRFVDLVSNLLQCYSCITKIYCLRVSFSFDSKDYNKLHQWIEFAFDRGVESLQFSCSYRPSKEKPIGEYNFYSYYYPRFEFPCDLLLISSTSTSNQQVAKKKNTLKHLQLKTCMLTLDDFHLRQPYNGLLFINTLVTIDFEDVWFDQENLLESLLSSCLFLQVLKLRKCLLLPSNFNVASPCLKCLDLLECSLIKLSISAANNLTTFRYINDRNSTSWVNFSFDSLPQLERLLISFPDKPEVHIPSILSKLPRDLPRLESLYLSCGTMEMPTLPMKLASFTNLKRLELYTRVHATVDLLWIASTVNALPLLFKLNVMLDNTEGDKTQGNIRAFEYQPHYQLKEILVNGFCAFWNEIELIICLLKNAVALEHMVIDPQRRCIGGDGKWEQWEPHAMKWNEGEDKERVYEIIHKETPGITNLVTIL